MGGGVKGEPEKLLHMDVHRLVLSYMFYAVLHYLQILPQILCSQFCVYGILQKAGKRWWSQNFEDGAESAG